MDQYFVTRKNFYLAPSPFFQWLSTVASSENVATEVCSAIYVLVSHFAYFTFQTFKHVYISA